jgi:hypothetical protein
MTSTPGDPEDRRLRRKSAAFRLKHDVGKALRWSAPEERETDTEALRARLAADLRPRASGGGASPGVLKSFFEWKREEGPLFSSDDPDLEAVERAMAVLRRFSPGLLSLEGSSLVALDEACLEAARACTAFYRRIALDDGPETMRSHGARR